MDIVSPNSEVNETAGSSASSALEALEVSHSYATDVALDCVSLTARRGEFVTLLGESGSGKTTLLRVIAGLERPRSIARLSIGGVDVTHKPASQRNATTVFQHYALFPHMSVGQNVEYGLRVRGIQVDERRQGVLEALDLVRLSDKADRRIHQLSGGERQRVALARALVTKPVVLLLDEPLAALDERLRSHMQTELKELHGQLGITFIYVTHSQDEALSMSDRIILMRRGRVVQEGLPRALLDCPANRFVAEFMGVDNLISGRLTAIEGSVATIDARGARLVGRWCGGSPPLAGLAVCAAIRAEHVSLHDTQPQTSNRVNVLACRPISRSERGRFCEVGVDSVAGALISRVWSGPQLLSAPAFASWDVEKCSITPMA